MPFSADSYLHVDPEKRELVYSTDSLTTLPCHSRIYKPWDSLAPMNSFLSTAEIGHLWENRRQVTWTKPPKKPPLSTTVAAAPMSPAYTHAWPRPSFIQVHTGHSYSFGSSTRFLSVDMSPADLHRHAHQNQPESSTRFSLTPKLSNSNWMGLERSLNCCTFWKLLGCIWCEDVELLNRRESFNSPLWKGRWKRGSPLN